MDSTSRAIVARAALHACLLSASATATAQATFDCWGCARSVFTCGVEATGDLSPDDCSQGDRFVDIWTLESAIWPGEAEIHIEATGFTPRLLTFRESFPEWGPPRWPEPSEACLTIAESLPCEDPALPGTACLRKQIWDPVILVVTSANDGETGSYTLRSGCGSARCDRVCQKTISCGETVFGDLAPGVGCTATSGVAFDTWELSLSSGDTSFKRVRISATSASPLIASIHDPERCIDLVPPRACAAGSCIDLLFFSFWPIDISIAAPAPGATYELSVSCEEFDRCTGCTIAGSVACGSSVTSRLGPEDCEVAYATLDGAYRWREERWTLDVTETGLYKVSADAPDGVVHASVVQIKDCEGIPENPLSIFNGACPPGTDGDSCFMIGLGPGAYFVTVSMEVPGDQRDVPPVDYSLSVECVDPGSCRDCVRGSVPCDGKAAGRLAPAAGCEGAGGAPLDVWSFELGAGPAYVTFTARSDAFAPRVVVLDGPCHKTTIASGDQCPGSPGAACTTLFAASSTLIHVGVTSDSPQAAGDYEIEVVCERGPFSACGTRCAEGELRGNEFATGELTEDDCPHPQSGLQFDAWTYTTASPGTFEVLVEASGFAPGVEVLDTSCAPIPIEGSLAGELRRGVFDLNAGTYRIVVQNDVSGALGQYRLRVKPFSDCAACPASSPAPCLEDGVLSGVFGQGGCPDADGFFYEAFDLELPAARDVHISPRPGVDVLLWIFDEGCRRLGSISTESGLWTLLEPGKYRIVVSSFAPDTPGSWSVSFSCRETAFCAERCIAGTLECGEPASGTLDEDDCKWFANVLDVWRLEVPLGGASLRVRQDTEAPVFFEAFPVACHAPAQLEQLCELNRSGGYFCDLAPGSYLLNVSTPRSAILHWGRPSYTIDVTTSACGQYGDQLPGDCNQDGKLDIADGVCLLSHLFQGKWSELSCAAGGLGLAGRSLLDWNGDRVLDLTDPIALLVHLFQSGVPHVLGSECVPGAGCPEVCME